MRPLLFAGLALALLGGCASQGGDDFRKRPLSANPSAFIAAEIAFARLAQEKGQWTAFRETSDPEAVMFVPQRVKARDWLKTQKDPAQAVKWQPHKVFVSCDGNNGVTTGAWQNGAASGFFTTVWRRDPMDGKLRWLIDSGDALATPRAAPEFIESKQATCGTKPAVAAAPAVAGEDTTLGVSGDQSLSWTSTIRADGSRRLTVRLWDGSEMKPVIDDQIAAPRQP